MEFEQDPADALDYTADFEAHCVRYREPGTAYASGVKVRPRRATGLQYSSGGGVTGTDEPRWPTTVGGTVRDGSVTWTAEALADTSLTRTLASASWVADTGVTVSTPVSTPTSSTAVVSAADEGSYLVRCAGTFSDGTVKNLAFTLDVVRPSNGGA